MKMILKVAHLFLYAYETQSFTTSESAIGCNNSLRFIMTSSYYRPEWTCGKFNKAKCTAILYNLIEGVSHFFEGDSAVVIGAVLSHHRNEKFSVDEVSIVTGIDVDSLDYFFIELIQLGLLTTHIFNEVEIIKYRHTIAHQNYKDYDCERIQPKGVEVMEYGLNGAEEDYAESIDGWANVVFEMTYRCSEKCIHCYNIGSTHNAEDIDRRGERNELVFDEYKSAIDQLIKQGMFKICLTGGDPFSKDIIWDIIEYLYEKEVAVEIYTNGISIVNKVEKLLALYPRIVGLTVYSADASIHDKITRTKGSLEKTLATMKKLSEFAVPLQLKCCVFKTNFSTYKTVYSLAEQFNALPQIEINIKNSIDGNRFASECLTTYR